MTDKANASIDRIESFLSVLQDNIKFLESVAQAKMRDFSLVVSDADERLQEAHELQWPTAELGDREKYISFDYYRAMSSLDSASAQYITQRYEEAARDMTGTDFIDILLLLKVVKQEAQLIEVFLSQKSRFAGSDLELEVLENFQSWVQLALRHTKHIHEEFVEYSPASKDNNMLSPDRARRNQAVFKAKLNGYNDLITSAEDTLRRSFLETAPVFYSKFLSAGLNTSNMAKARRTGTTSKALVKSTEGAAKAIDSQLKGLIEDQERRISLYKNKTEVAFNELKRRRNARNGIKELSEVGKSLPTDGPGVMVRGVQVKPAEKVYWSRLVNAPKTAPPLRGSHQDLPGLTEGNSHSQYLLKSGGTVTGDIEVVDEKRLDGVDISEHRHRGTDGSPQIHGDDIVKGTFKEEVVSTEDIPPKPINLTAPRMDIDVVPPGVTVIDTHLSFDSFDRYGHEIEIRRVPIAEEEIELDKGWIVGDVIVTDGYNASIIPIEHSLFAYMNPTGWTGGSVVVASIDAEGSVTEMASITFEDAGFDNGTLVQTGSNRWVGVHSSHLVGFVYDPDTQQITTTDGGDPDGSPGGSPARYDPTLDVGVTFKHSYRSDIGTTVPVVGIFQWREGDAAPTFTEHAVPYRRIGGFDEAAEGDVLDGVIYVMSSTPMDEPYDEDIWYLHEMSLDGTLTSSVFVPTSGIGTDLSSGGHVVRNGGRSYWSGFYELEPSGEVDLEGGFRRDDLLDFPDPPAGVGGNDTSWTVLDQQREIVFVSVRNYVGSNTADYGRLFAYDVSDPDNLALLGVLDLGNIGLLKHLALRESDNTVFVGFGEQLPLQYDGNPESRIGGLVAVDVSDPTSMTIAGQIDRDDDPRLGYAFGPTLLQSGDHVVMASNPVPSEYHWMILDVSDVTNMSIVADLDPGAMFNLSGYLSYGVGDASGDHVFATADDPNYAGKRLWAIDVSTPTAPVVVGSIGPAGPFTEDRVPFLFRGETAFTSDGTYLYKVSSNGMTVFDISDPTNMQMAAYVTEADGNFTTSLGSANPGGMTVIGDTHIILCESNIHDLVIIDITTRDDPREVDRIELYSVSNPHKAWLVNRHLVGPGFDNMFSWGESPINEGGSFIVDPDGTTTRYDFGESDHGYFYFLPTVVDDPDVYFDPSWDPYPVRDAETGELIVEITASSGDSWDIWIYEDTAMIHDPISSDGVNWYAFGYDDYTAEVDAHVFQMIGYGVIQPQQKDVV